MAPGEALPADLARESKFLLFTRLGFVARGVLYILIAALVLGTGRTEDLTGALDYVGHGPGRFMLIGMAAGMATYAFWRFADALFGIENAGSDGKAYRKRAAAGFIGAIYLFLAYKAARILAGSQVSDAGAHEHANAALHFPGGEWVVGAAALVMFVAGLNQLRKAAKCSFLYRLREPARQPLVKWLGRAGYGARGIIFIAVAWLLLRSALDHDAAQAGGMEQALDFLRGPVEYAIAAGLMLFGAFSLVEARYRRIHQPPVDALKREVREKIAQ